MTKSTASFACRTETHDLCARRWKNGEKECFCDCSCHEEQRLVAARGIIEFARAFQRIFLDCLPLPIQADWDTVYGPLLAGFPANICYVDLGRDYGRNHATYYFDPTTYSEDSEERRMWYYPEKGSAFWVEVLHGRADASRMRGSFALAPALMLAQTQRLRFRSARQ